MGLFHTTKLSLPWCHRKVEFSSRESSKRPSEDVAQLEVEPLETLPPKATGEVECLGRLGRWKRRKGDGVGKDLKPSRWRFGCWRMWLYIYIYIYENRSIQI